MLQAAARFTPHQKARLFQAYCAARKDQATLLQQRKRILAAMQVRSACCATSLALTSAHAVAALVGASLHAQQHPMCTHLSSSTASAAVRGTFSTAHSAAAKRWSDPTLLHVQQGYGEGCLSFGWVGGGGR